jgi:hypothetical protein
MNEPLALWSILFRHEFGRLGAVLTRHGTGREHCARPIRS